MNALSASVGIALLANAWCASGARAQAPSGDGSMGDGAGAAAEYSAYTLVPPEEQERSGMQFAYRMAFPIGDLHDFIGNPSYRGFEASALTPAVGSLYLGVTFGYNFLQEDTGRKTLPVESGAITGRLYRFADVWSLGLLARYPFLSPGAVLRPFLGVALGLVDYSMSTYVADQIYNVSPVGFLVAPEAGLLLRMTSWLSGVASYRFDFSTTQRRGYKELSFSAVQIGIWIQPAAQ